MDDVRVPQRCGWGVRVAGQQVSGVVSLLLWPLREFVAIDENDVFEEQSR